MALNSFLSNYIRHSLESKGIKQWSEFGKSKGGYADLMHNVATGSKVTR